MSDNACSELASVLGKLAVALVDPSRAREDLEVRPKLIQLRCALDVEVEARANAGCTL